MNDGNEKKIKKNIYWDKAITLIVTVILASIVITFLKMLGLSGSLVSMAIVVGSYYLVRDIRQKIGRKSKTVNIIKE